MNVGAWRVLEYNVAVYRRTWRSSVGVSLLVPIFFLGAVGLGVGQMVDQGSGGIYGVPYLLFVAPGLLASTAMQFAANETTVPVLGKVNRHIYEAMLATPLGVDEILMGELLWLVFRLTLVACASMAAMTVLGVVRSPTALLSIPAAILIGLAFGTPILAFIAARPNEQYVSFLFRLILAPLFLFSGTVFPLERLPSIAQVVLSISPLNHGVVLIRGLMLGNLGVADNVVHVAWLVAFFAFGAIAARRALSWRLVK